MKATLFTKQLLIVTNKILYLYLGYIYYCDDSISQTPIKNEIFFLNCFNIGQKIVQRLRSNIFRSVVSQEIAFFDKEKSGELITRLATDTSLVSRAITDNISDGLRASAQAVGGISLMVYIYICICLLYKVHFLVVLVALSLFLHLYSLHFILLRN